MGDKVPKTLQFEVAKHFTTIQTDNPKMSDEILPAEYRKILEYFRGRYAVFQRVGRTLDAFSLLEYNDPDVMHVQGVTIPYGMYVGGSSGVPTYSEPLLFIAGAEATSDDGITIAYAVSKTWTVYELRGTSIPVQKLHAEHLGCKYFAEQKETAQKKAQEKSV